MVKEIIYMAVLFVLGSFLNYLAIVFIFKDAIYKRFFLYILPIVSVTLFSGQVAGIIGFDNLLITAPIFIITSGTILITFNLLNKKFGSVMLQASSKINEKQEHSVSSYKQLSYGSNELASSANIQAATTEELSATIQELVGMSRQNAEATQHAHDMSKNASNIVVKNQTQLAEMQKSLEETRNATERSSQIIKTIDEIAFQTNLLALNAAVEAARAGQSGLGFAVVAEEVRRLAQRSADAARQTAAIINESIITIKKTAEISDGAIKAFYEINDYVNKMNHLMNDIDIQSKEQMNGLDQMKAGVEQIEGSTQRIASSAEEFAASITELENLAREVVSSTTELHDFVKGNE